MSSRSTARDQAVDPSSLVAAECATHRGRFARWHVEFEAAVTDLTSLRPSNELKNGRLSHEFFGRLQRVEALVDRGVGEDLVTDADFTSARERVFLHLVGSPAFFPFIPSLATSSLFERVRGDGDLLDDVEMPPDILAAVLTESEETLEDSFGDALATDDVFEELMKKPKIRRAAFETLSRQVQDLDRSYLKSVNDVIRADYFDSPEYRRVLTATLKDILTWKPHSGPTPQNMAPFDQVSQWTREFPLPADVKVALLPTVHAAIKRSLEVLADSHNLQVLPSKEFERQFELAEWYQSDEYYAAALGYMKVCIETDRLQELCRFCRRYDDASIAVDYTKLPYDFKSLFQRMAEQYLARSEDGEVEVGSGRYSPSEAQAAILELRRVLGPPLFVDIDLIFDLNARARQARRRPIDNND